MGRPFRALVAAALLTLLVTGCASGTTQPATDITDTAATLNGTGNANGVQTTFWFQYGATTAYGTQTPQKDGGSGTQPSNITERVTSLSPDTTYHFRLVARQSGSPTVYGPDEVFRTLPSSSTQPASAGVFAVYYLWWDRQHWDRLGPNYPYGQSPAPLPAAFDAAGCVTGSLFAGNTLTDVSEGLAYDQSKRSVIEQDVRQAAGAGLAGFSVNWAGTGASGQTPTSSAYNQRLQWVLDVVHQVNAEGIPFKLQLNYKTAGHPSAAQIANDLDYFAERYRDDAALDHSLSGKPEAVWTGSWGYSDAEKTSVSSAVRSRLYLIADDKSGWDANSAANFDGNSWYWPGQDPYKNPASFSQIQATANNVRATKNPDGSNKVWLAPFAPGYNPVLLYGGNTCVPRNNGDTMRRLYQGNAASNPDGWLLISWNEIAEASHIVPLTHYDHTYLNSLHNLLQTNP